MNDPDVDTTATKPLCSDQLGTRPSQSVARQEERCQLVVCRNGQDFRRWRNRLCNKCT